MIALSAGISTAPDTSTSIPVTDEAPLGSNQPLPKYASLHNDGETEDEFDAMEQLELEERAQRPFYRQPSPWWVIILMAIAAILFSTSIAPRIDVFTTLVCERLKPEIAISEGISTSTSLWRAFPRPSKECVQDAQVQAAVAALSTMMTVSSGLLGCLTVGWWGQFSDRYGRIPLFVLSASGLLITDGNFILVTQAFRWLPGGYNFLLVGAVLGGIFGGIPSFMAAAASYIAETSPPELRTRNLSLKTGLLLGGVAIGPALGSYIIQTTNNLLSVFYLGFVTHVMFILVLPFCVPESRTKASMLKARRRRAEIALKEQQLTSQGAEGRKPFTTFLSYLSKVFAFARPMSILLPHKRADGKGWDYNLFLVAITMSMNLFTMAIHNFNLQFLQRVFGWDSTTSGYWLTVVATFKAICLILILPLIIHIFKPKPTQPIELPGEESLLAEQEEILTESSPLRRSPSRSKPTHHTASFDYKLTIFALAMEMITYLSMSLSQTPIQYTIACMMGGLGTGFTPAIKSVAMSLYEQGPHEGMEVGRLFGALGIVEALSGFALGPVLFGSIFVKTVGTFPQAIYAVASGVIVIATIVFSFLKLRVTPRSPRTESI